MIPSYFRFGAGVCVLSTGLLLGGTGAGAALADSPSGGSTAGADGAGGSSEGTGSASTSASNPAAAPSVTVSGPATTAATAASSPSTAPVAGPGLSAINPFEISPSSIASSISDTLSTTLRDITTTLGSGRIPGQHSSAVEGEELLPSTSGEAKAETEAVPAVPTGSSAPAAAPAAAAADPPPAAASTDPSAAAADVAGAAHDSGMPAPGVISAASPGGHSGDQLIGPFQDMITSFSGTVGDAFRVIGPFQDMLGAVSTAVGFTGVIGPVQDMLAAYSALYPKAAPYIAPVQDWLTWVDTTIARPLDSEMSLLFGPAWMQPRVDVAGVVDSETLALGLDVPPVPAALPMNSTMPADFLSPSDMGVPMAGGAAGVASLGIATSRADSASALPGEITDTATHAIPAGVQKFFRQAFRELVKSPSLAALAVTALPGVAGILILTAAGARLGYRQAKAQLALKAAGIARFAGPGPIGVVRSGAFVSVARRSARVVRPVRSGRAAGLAPVVMLDRAA